MKNLPRLKIRPKNTKNRTKTAFVSEFTKHNLLKEIAEIIHIMRIIEVAGGLTVAGWYKKEVKALAQTGNFRDGSKQQSQQRN